MENNPAMFETKQKKTPAESQTCTSPCPAMDYLRWDFSRISPDLWKFWWEIIHHGPRITCLCLTTTSNNQKQITMENQWKNTDIYIYVILYIYTHYTYILYTLEWFWNYCSGYFSWDPQTSFQWNTRVIYRGIGLALDPVAWRSHGDVAKFFGHIFGYVFTRHTTVDGCEIVPYCTHMPCNIGKHTGFLPPLKQLVAKSYINVVSTVVNIPWFTGFQHVSTIRLVQDFAGPSGGHRAQLK